MNRGLTDVTTKQTVAALTCISAKSSLKIYRFCNSIITAPHPGLRAEQAIVIRERLMNRKQNTEEDKDNTERQSNLTFTCLYVGLKISSVFKQRNTSIQTAQNQT